MYSVPVYPDFAPFTEDFFEEMQPVFQSLSGGVSELTFYSVLAHSVKYSYRITKTAEHIYFLLRNSHETAQAVFINGVPSIEIIEELTCNGVQLVLLSEPMAETNRLLFESAGLHLEKDRSNADYVYERSALADLKDKNLRKKKSHVNAFLSEYQPEVQPLTGKNVEDALSVLNAWHAEHTESADYDTALFALRFLDRGVFLGIVVYINKKPVGWALGELLCGDSMFCTHFEKAIDGVRGVYQFLNREMAIFLPESVVYINREQDLSDEGLRQAKMTYRPAFFVEKYRAVKMEKVKTNRLIP